MEGEEWYSRLSSDPYKCFQAQMQTHTTNMQKLFFPLLFCYLRQFRWIILASLKVSVDPDSLELFLSASASASGVLGLKACVDHLVATHSGRVRAGEGCEKKFKKSSQSKKKCDLWHCLIPPVWNYRRNSHQMRKFPEEEKRLVKKKSFQITYLFSK